MFKYFGVKFGEETRIRQKAFDKIQELMAKENELLSLGGQAAAAAHSLGTPLSTIKVISKELNKSLGKNLDHRKDIELLISQVERCENILKKLTIDPLVKDDFINQNLSLADYVKEIIKSFEEISKKMFVVNLEQDSNPFQITKSIELIYGTVSYTHLRAHETPEHLGFRLVL